MDGKGRVGGRVGGRNGWRVGGWMDQSTTVSLKYDQICELNNNKCCTDWFKNLLML